MGHGIEKAATAQLDRATARRKIGRREDMQATAIHRAPHIVTRDELPRQRLRICHPEAATLAWFDTETFLLPILHTILTTLSPAPCRKMSTGQCEAEAVGCRHFVGKKSSNLRPPSLNSTRAPRAASASWSDGAARARTEKSMHLNRMPQARTSPAELRVA